MKKLFSLLLAATMTFSLTLPALADHYTYSEPEKSTMMPRSTPETHGMSSQYILDLLDAFDYADAEVHNILMAIDGEVVFEGHYAPYTALDPHHVLRHQDLHQCRCRRCRHRRVSASGRLCVRCVEGLRDAGRIRAAIQSAAETPAHHDQRRGSLYERQRTAPANHQLDRAHSDGAHCA